MGLFSSETLEDLRALVVNQIKDLYDAEHRIVEALPTMVEKASSAQLRQALDTHLAESHGHIAILESVFDLLDEEPERETCEACRGLLEEVEEILDAEATPAVIDAGIILAAQKVEHYEMAGYGGAAALSEQIGESEVADLLKKILAEERASDIKLTIIAEGSVNQRASKSEPMRS